MNGVDAMILQFADDPAKQKEYMKWQALPMTQFVFQAIQRLHRPIMPPTTDLNVLAIAHAGQCMLDTVIETGLNLDKVLEPHVEPEVDYGGDKVMEKWGRVTAPKGAK